MYFILIRVVWNEILGNENKKINLFDFNTYSFNGTKICDESLFLKPIIFYFYCNMSIYTPTDDITFIIY